MNFFDWLGFESASEAKKKHQQLLIRIMKAEEAIAKLQQANADQTEALTEINTKFDALDARIKELEDLVANAELPADVAAKIEEVAAGAKALADVIPNPPPPPPPEG